MAADDQQISQNRRRLFKALSSAPVVATLSPGAALANQSAFQCLVNPTTPASFHVTDPGCGAGETCFAYLERTFWDMSTGLATGASTNAWPQEARDLLNAIIIEGGTAGQYYLFDSTNDTATLLSPINIELSLSGTDLVMSNVSGSNPAFTWTVPASSGQALVYVDPLDANMMSTPAGSLNAVDVEIVGVFPDQQMTGNLQGITQTCLASINPNAMGIGSKGFNYLRG